MVIVLRILLILLPVALLIIWLRMRIKKKAGQEITDKELARTRWGLLALVLTILAVGIGLKLTDTSADTAQVYVPARVENGELIPGHFISAEEAARLDKETLSNTSSSEEKPDNENPG